MPFINEMDSYGYSFKLEGTIITIRVQLTGTNYKYHAV